MVQAVETMDGWFVLHDLRRINWSKLKDASVEKQDKIVTELLASYEEWNQNEEERQGSFGVFQIIGQKADVMFVFLRPTIEEILDLETALNKSPLAEYLIPADSYLSVVELSKYRPSKDGIDPETLPETQQRLKPILKKWDYISFYPMNRKRDGEDNWYTLEKEERGKLLYEHSITGRKYAGKVEQIITGSTGIDKWEWGVTLFSHDFLQLKKIVYEMRYDTATSRYGEFGDFFVGKTVNAETLQKLLTV